MKSETKVQFGVVGYSLLLCPGNWSLEHDYDRQSGLLRSGIDLRIYGILFSAAAAYILLMKVSSVRESLRGRRVQIPQSIRLWRYWKSLFFLLPFCYSSTNSSYGYVEDGAIRHTVFEYGGELSLLLIFFAGATILLFEFLVRLEFLDLKEQRDGKTIANPRLL